MQFMSRYSAIPLFLSLIAISSTAQAEDKVGKEKWADAALPVTSGLELWLDAGRLNAAQGQRRKRDRRRRQSRNLVRRFRPRP